MNNLHNRSQKADKKHSPETIKKINIISDFKEDFQFFKIISDIFYKLNFAFQEKRGLFNSISDICYRQN